MRERRSATGRVVHRLLREHGHEHGEEAISNTTQRPAVAVAMPAEPPVMLATVRVVPHADEAPVVKRVAKARIAGVAHADEEAFAALPRHGREKGRIVYGDEDEWQRDNFIATMRERKLFREVAPLEALYPDVDLVATVSRTVVDADNPLPFWTFLTLGVFPTVANATERYVVTFAPPDAKPTVRVEAEHRGKIVIGWAGGLFAVIAPGWMFPGTYTRRMHEQLELAIAQKADAIFALAGR